MTRRKKSKLLLLALPVMLLCGFQSQCGGPPPPPSGGQPATSLHLAANGNFDNAGNYLLGALGFNLADVGGRSDVDALPAGVKGLDYIGACNGADAGFQSNVDAFVGASNLYGFYLMDEPDPASCSPANIAAEADYIHQKLPGVKAFAVLLDMGADNNPSYANGYTPANSHLDQVGLDPYPCRNDGAVLPCDYSVIGHAVIAANAVGWPTAAIVPVYQAFGNGGALPWVMPTATQEQAILQAWGAATPTPPWDYTYSYGLQYSGETALVNAGADVQKVFSAHNGVS